MRAHRKPPCDVKRGRPRAEHQNLVRQDEIRNHGGDRLAFGDHQRLAIGEGRLKRERSGGAAIGAVDELLFLKLHQVPPDGFAGDTEHRREFRGDGLSLERTAK